MLLDADLDRIADRLVEKMEARGKGIAPRLMDIAQAATYLGRTVSGIQHMLKRRTLPATRIDGKVQIDRLELDKLIADRTS